MRHSVKISSRLNCLTSLEYILKIIIDARNAARRIQHNKVIIVQQQQQLVMNAPRHLNYNRYKST